MHYGIDEGKNEGELTNPRLSFVYSTPQLVIGLDLACRLGLSVSAEACSGWMAKHVGELKILMPTKANHPLNSIFLPINGLVK